jgi:hypothetical protein
VKFGEKVDYWLKNQAVRVFAPTQKVSPHFASLALLQTERSIDSLQKVRS